MKVQLEDTSSTAVGTALQSGAWVEELVPGRNGRIIRLQEDGILLGRYSTRIKPSNSVRGVAGYHARVDRGVKGRYSIRTLSPGIAVRINGYRVNSAPLTDGDIIDLGDWRLEFIEAEEQARPAGETDLW